MSKQLVAYFSASGITAKVAENLADAIGADIFEIQPKVPYTKADLNWMDKKARSTIEMSDPASRPAIAVKRDNMEDYDTIFVGFPIWWYVAPTIINTFLESYDLTGKTIIPFATSGGSGMGKTNKKLAPSCPGAKLLHGKVFPATSTKADLSAWVESICSYTKWKHIFAEILKCTILVYDIDYIEFCNKKNVSDSAFRRWRMGSRLPQSTLFADLKDFIRSKISLDITKSECIYGAFYKIFFDNDALTVYDNLCDRFINPKDFVAETFNVVFHLAHNQPIPLIPQNTVKSSGKTKVVFFDFDGTLTVDSKSHTTWETLWIRLGYNISECQKLHRQFNEKKITHEEWCEKTKEKFVQKHLQRDDVEEVAKKIHLIKGVKKVFSQLDKAGIKIYIISGSIDTVIDRVLGSNRQYVHNIKANHFSYTDGSGLLSEIVGTKYDFEGKATFIKKVSDELHIPTCDMLFVGNSLNDRFAYQAGIQTLCINPKDVDYTDKNVWTNYIPKCTNLEEILPYIKM